MQISLRKEKLAFTYLYQPGNSSLTLLSSIICVRSVEPAFYAKDTN